MLHSVFDVGLYFFVITIFLGVRTVVGSNAGSSIDEPNPLRTNLDQILSHLTNTVTLIDGFLDLEGL